MLSDEATVYFCSAFHCILKLARTIVDLEGAAMIEASVQLSLLSIQILLKADG